MAQENSKEFSPFFLILACLFVMFLLLSNIIAGKLIQVCGLVLPAAVILFPLTYLFGDVLTEVYGYRKSRLVIWVGFACNILMALIFLVVIILPYPSFWQNQHAYATVLGMTPRLVAASLAGLLGRGIFQFRHPVADEEADRRTVAVDPHHRLDGESARGWTP